MQVYLMQTFAWLSVALSSLALACQYWWFSQSWVHEQQPSVHGKTGMLLYFFLFFVAPGIGLKLGLAALAIAPEEKSEGSNRHAIVWAARIGFILGLLGLLLCIPVFLLGFRGVEFGKGMWG